MSADWWATTPGCEGCKCPGHSIGEWNLTYNLSPMLWEAGFAGWQDVVGKVEPIPTGKSVVAAMEPVLAELRSDPEKYQAMNPPNGWGTYEIAVEVLADCIDSLREHPDAVVESWL